MAKKVFNPFSGKWIDDPREKILQDQKQSKVIPLNSVKQEDIVTAVSAVPSVDITAETQEGSPFDRIRHEDEQGEYWLARELQTVLGYVEWRKFEDAVERAKLAIANVGENSNDHIGSVAKKVSIGSGAERAVKDYHLTRYACYMIAMNGDPRKPEIAAAQTYFAVKTRQAELISQQQVQIPATPAMAILEIGKAMVAMEQNQNKQNVMVQNQISDLISTDQKLQEQIDQNSQDIREFREQLNNRSSNNVSVLTGERNYNPITVNGNTTVAETADIFKELGYDTGRNKLYDYLVDNDMLRRYKNKGYKAKKRFLDLGWFVNSTEEIELPNGATVEQYKVDVTPVGRRGLLIRFEGGRT